MYKKLLFASFLLVLGFAEVGFGQNQRLLSQASRMTGDQFMIATRTPRGANVYAVNRPAPGVLNAIDRGLTDLFAVARKNGYRNRLNYADYSIYIAKADRQQNSDGQYSPDIAVGAAQYRGSVFDKGGFIYAAGFVLSREPSAFVVGEHTRDFDRLANVIRYEGEHLVLYHNDRARHAATADHSRGGAHPILQ
ncbi:MAG: hypothetical protein ABR530_10570 [Pyrinomonadaceae bacterium]